MTAMALRIPASRPDLSGCRVLVLEDEFLVGMAIQDALEEHGATVVGPLPSVAAALGRLQQREPLDAALLDVNLHGESSAPVAMALRAIDVPFALVTGYDRADLIDPFLAGAPQVRKPFAARDIALAAERLLQSRRR